MNTIEHAIARARRRMIVQHALGALGWSLLAAVCVSLVLLLVERLAAVSVSPWVYGVLIGALVAAAPVVAWLGRPGRESAATLIDQRLQLKDRIGTALYAESMQADPFAQQVMRDAQDAAGHARVAGAFPIHLTRVWGWLPPALGLLALVAVFVQPMDLFGLEEARLDRERLEEQAQADKDQLAKAIKAIKLTEPKDGQQPEAAVQMMQQLADLTNRDLSNPELRRQAAAKVAQVKDRIAADANKKQKQLNQLQNALSRLDTEQKGPADKFADALRRGDFDAAKEALEELGEAFDNMSDADKKALGQQLDNLAKQLDQAAKQFAQQQAQSKQQTQQQMQQALQNAGMNQQQAQQLAQQAQNMTQQQLQQQLQQQGMSQQQAQQTAQQLKQMQQQAQQQQQQAGQCKQCAGGMSKSLSKMGQACKNPGQGGSFKQGAGQCQGGLSQMAQMQQNLQQMRMAQSAMQQSLNQLGQPNQGGAPNTQMQQTLKKGGGVGPGIGSGDGGNPFGHERQHKNYQTKAEGDIGQGEGRVIASWLNKGDNVKGAPKVAFNQAVTEARSEAEKAVTDDRVPRQYHKTIRQYFDQLPRSADQVQGGDQKTDGE